MYCPKTGDDIIDIVASLQSFTNNQIIIKNKKEIVIGIDIDSMRYIKTVKRSNGTTYLVYQHGIDRYIVMNTNHIIHGRSNNTSSGGRYINTSPQTHEVFNTLVSRQ